MAFPASPSNGEIVTENGIRYVYASATNSWTRQTLANATFSVISDTFTGDGSSTSFLLTVTPTGKDYVTVVIDGVTQLNYAYNLANNVITFNGIPPNGSIIEVKTWTSSNTGVLTGLVYDSYTGDGTTVNYTLNATPTNRIYTMVTVGGITQNKSTYTVSGSVLTFTTAPPNTAPIEVTTFGPAITTSTAAGSNTQVQFNSLGALGASANLTFDSSTSTLNATNITQNSIPVVSTGKAMALNIVFGGF